MINSCIIPVKDSIVNKQLKFLNKMFGVVNLNINIVRLSLKTIN